MSKDADLLPPTSAAQLARILGISPKRLRRWIRSRWPRAGADRFHVRTLTPEQIAQAHAWFGAPHDHPLAGPVAPTLNRPVGRRPQEFKLSVAREALRLRAQADRLLRAAGITKNDLELVGQLAELLVASAFDGKAAAASQSGYDIVLSDGTRIQVKARIAKAGLVGKQVFMRGFAKSPRPFDELIYLQFTPEYELEHAVRYAVDAVAPPIATHVPHSNTWRLRMTADFLAKGVNVISDVRSAYEGLA